MRQLRVESLQWSVGGYGTLIGVLMMLGPHLFNSPTYGALPLHLSAWGALVAVAGSAPLAVAILAPSSRLLVAAHLLAGAVLLVMAASAAVSGGWMGLIGSGGLAVGTLTVPCVTRARRSGPDLLPDLRTLEDHPSAPPGTDLLALVVATFACSTGVLLLVVPGLSAAPIYDGSQPLERPLGALLVANGPFLLLVERRSTPWLVYAVAHWLIAGSLFLLLVLVARPAGLWTSVAYCTVCGGIMGLRPWPHWRLPTPQDISLRARLGLSLAIAAAVPLVLAAAVGANREEQWIISEFLTGSRGLAMSVSADVGEYADQYRAAVSAFAGRRGLLDYPTEDLRRLLQETRAGYPDALAFGVFRPTVR